MLITLITASWFTPSWEFMGNLTEREKEILRRLKDGKTVNEIGKNLGTPVTSISRSITSIRRKAGDLEEDIAFLQEIGYLSFEKGRFKFVSPDKDPKALGKMRR